MNRRITFIVLTSLVVLLTVLAWVTQQKLQGQTSGWGECTMAPNAQPPLCADGYNYFGSYCYKPNNAPCTNTYGQNGYCAAGACFVNGTGGGTTGGDTGGITGGEGSSASFDDPFNDNSSTNNNNSSTDQNSSTTNNQSSSTAANSSTAGNSSTDNNNSSTDQNSSTNNSNSANSSTCNLSCDDLNGPPPWCTPGRWMSYCDLPTCSIVEFQCPSCPSGYSCVEQAQCRNAMGMAGGICGKNTQVCCADTANSSKNSNSSGGSNNSNSSNNSASQSASRNSSNNSASHSASNNSSTNSSVTNSSNSSTNSSVASSNNSSSNNSNSSTSNKSSTSSNSSAPCATSSSNQVISQARPSFFASLFNFFTFKKSPLIAQVTNLNPVRVRITYSKAESTTTKYTVSPISYIDGPKTAGDNASPLTPLIGIPSGQWFDVEQISKSEYPINATHGGPELTRPDGVNTAKLIGFDGSFGIKFNTQYWFPNDNNYATYYGTIEMEGATIKDAKCRFNSDTYIWYCPEQDNNTTYSAPDDDEVYIQNGIVHFFMHAKNVGNNEGRTDTFTVAYNFSTSSVGTSSVSTRSSSTSLPPCPNSSSSKASSKSSSTPSSNPSSCTTTVALTPRRSFIASIFDFFFGEPKAQLQLPPTLRVRITYTKAESTDSSRTVSPVTYIDGPTTGFLNRPLVSVKSGEWFNVEDIGEKVIMNTPGSTLHSGWSSFRISLSSNFLPQDNSYVSYYGTIEMEGSTIISARCRDKDSDPLRLYCPEREHDGTYSAPNDDVVYIENGVVHFFIHAKKDLTYNSIYPGSNSDLDQFTVAFRWDTSISSLSSTSSTASSTTSTTNSNTSSTPTSSVTSTQNNPCPYSSTSSKSSSRSSTSAFTCTNNNDCPTNKICRNGNCVDTSSASSSATQNSQRSDAGSNSSQIAFGVCYGNECHQGGDEFCAQQNKICDTINNLPCIRCIGNNNSSMPNNCTNEFQCPSGYCIDGRCTNPSSSTPFTPYIPTSTTPYLPPSDPSCTNNSQCPSGFCVDGRCTETPSCTNNQECPSNLCIDGRCAGCSSNFDCPLGFLCQNNSCNPCTDNIQCKTNLCINGTCAQCLNDTQCADGYHCQNGQCINICLTDKDCTDGQRCILNRCLSSIQIANNSFCGNTRIDPGETCDNGTDNSNQPNAACRVDCTKSGCGDSIPDTPIEQCDDGNQDNNDGCSSVCLPERSAPNQTLPAQIIELPFLRNTNNNQNNTTQPAGSIESPSFVITKSNAPSTPGSGPASLAVMLAGGAAGWLYKRRRD